MIGNFRFLNIMKKRPNQFKSVLFPPPGGGGGSGGGGIDDVLTGFVSGPGTVTDADTVLSAIQKLDGNITAITDSIQDQEFTQPSAGTSWIFTHNRGKKVNLAFFNSAGEREIPIESQATLNQVSVTFATSEVHTAILPGNGTSASLRNDSTITLLASDINTALGVIDITTAKTIFITMDANLTSDITFTGTPSAGTPLRLIFVNGATAYTATLAVAKFKSSSTAVIPVPLLPVTINTEHSFDFILGSLSSKMVLTGYCLGM